MVAAPPGLVPLGHTDKFLGVDKLVAPIRFPNLNVLLRVFPSVAQGFTEHYSRFDLPENEGFPNVRIVPVVIG